jgi:hypothetical protein
MVRKRFALAGYNQSALARELAPRNPKPMQAIISKVLAGKPISRATERKLKRALGLLQPPRKLHRIVVTPEQLQAWHNGQPIQKTQTPPE